MSPTYGFTQRDYRQRYDKADSLPWSSICVHNSQVIIKMVPFMSQLAYCGELIPIALDKWNISPSKPAIWAQTDIFM